MTDPETDVHGTLNTPERVAQIEKKAREAVAKLEEALTSFDGNTLANLLSYFLDLSAGIAVGVGNSVRATKYRDEAYANMLRKCLVAVDYSVGGVIRMVSGETWRMDKEDIDKLWAELHGEEKPLAGK